MTRFLAFWALLTATFPALAQERHFLYLQADNEQAFYLKLAGETRSSTPAGYLILPRLVDSTLEFVVGFPLRKYPEYSFRVDGIDRDRGYALKDFGEKGWGLFDMQSMEVSMGKLVSKRETVVKTASIVAVRDSFATILASVVGDSAVLDASLIVRQSELDPKQLISTVARIDSGMATPTVPSTVQRRSVDSARAIAVVEERKPPVSSSPPSADTATMVTGAGAAKGSTSPVRSSTNKSDSIGAIRMTLPENLPGRARTAKKDTLSASMPNNASVKSLRQDTAAITRSDKPLPAEVLSAVGVQAAPAPVSASRPVYVAETKKLLEYSDSSGWQIVFSDRNERGGIDTVSVWIPSRVQMFPGVAGNDPVRPERTDCQGKITVSELSQLRRRMEAIPDEEPASVAVAAPEALPEGAPEALPEGAPLPVGGIEV
ncbi:MAG: hypothetical protein EBZ67_11510, partial [Chitinophagia bacterium]|nr:hypothetical protein [Chitinophagia bacterium]